MKQTLNSFLITPLSGNPLAVKVRLAADVPFIASTGEVHPAGNSQTNYVEYSLTISGNGRTFPTASGIDSTTDSSDPNATYTLYLLDANNKEIGAQFERWIFDASLGASILYSDLESRNTHKVPLRDDQSYSKMQVDNLLLNRTFATPATLSDFGVVKITGPSTTAASTDDPRFAPPVIFDANASPYLAVPEDNTIPNNGARITQCLPAPVDYSIAHGKVPVSVLFTPGLYYINDSLSTANLARAQITLPLTTYLQSVSLSIEPKGSYSGGPALGPGWLTSSQSGNSVVFSSSLTGLSQTAAGTPFVMGGPDDVNQGSYPIGKSWLFLTLRDIGFVVPANPTLGGFNGKNVGQVYLKNVSCHAQAPDPTVFPTNYTQPTHPTALSFLVPSTLGDGAIYEGKVDVNGMYAGPGIGEHTVSDANIFVYKCHVGLNYESSAALPVAYGPIIQHFEDVQNPYGIAVVDPSSGIVPVAVGPSLDNVQDIFINKWIIEEASSGWNARVAGIYDPASRLAGIVNYRMNRIGTGTNRGFTESQYYMRNVKAVSLAEPFWERDFLVDPLYGNSNGASLTGRWPQRNQGDNWHTIPSSGTETITSFTYSGTVSPNSAESGNYIDESISDTVSSAQVMFNSLGTNWVGLGIRYQDENHYWIVRWDANGTISLKKKTAADTYSTVGTGTLVPVVNTWYAMAIATNGNSIEVFVDGTAVTAVSDATYATQTKVLIMGGGSGAVTVKTLRVTPLFL